MNKKAKETKKVKVFLFAPVEPKLRTLLAVHNNVRDAKYVTPNETTDYIRVRVRKRSDSVIGIAKQFANVAAPIIEYKVGDGVKGDRIVATIRVPGAGRFAEVVAAAEKVCKEVWGASHKAHVQNSSCPEIFLTCRVSDIKARDETPWVEVFAVQKHAVPVELWKEQVVKLAKEVGCEPLFHNAKIVEF